MWYTDTTGLYSFIKDDEMMSFAGEEMELETIRLSKISRKGQGHMLSYVEAREGKEKKGGANFMEIKGGSVEERDQGGRGREGKCQGGTLAELHCYLLCMCEYVTINPIILYSYNRRIRNNNSQIERRQTIDPGLWTFILSQ